jgi:membrane protein DedA with SNARE-associated domain
VILRSAVVLSAAGTAGATIPPESTQQALGYPSLFLLVLIGALVPVVPTGALVSSAAVVAFHQTAPFSLALVFGVASLAAFLWTTTVSPCWSCPGWSPPGASR